MKHHRTENGVWKGILVLIIFMAVAGCGPKIRPPVDKISNAEMAINRAREADAMTYAPLDLKLAEDDLENAKKMLSNHDYPEADREAQRAIIDAKVAEARSNAEKAKDLSEQMQDTVDMLRQELERKKIMDD